MLGLEIAGAAGSLLGGLTSIGSNRRQYKFQKKLAQQQFEYQKELFNMSSAENERMWNLENAYNDPSAQRARLEAAGLNPALLYSNSASGASGVGATLDTPSTPSYGQIPQMDYDPNPVGTAVDNVLGGLDKLAGIRESLSRTNLNESQKEFIATQSEESQSRKQLYDSQNTTEKMKSSLMEIEKYTAQATQLATIEGAQVSLDTLKWQNNQARYLSKQLANEADASIYKLAKSRADLVLTMGQISNLAVQQAYTQTQIDYYNKFGERMGEAQLADLYQSIALKAEELMRMQIENDNLPGYLDSRNKKAHKEQASYYYRIAGDFLLSLAGVGLQYAGLAYGRRPVGSAMPAPSASSVPGTPPKWHSTGTNF